MAEPPSAPPDGEQQHVEPLRRHRQRLRRANRIALAESIAWSLLACLPLASLVLRAGASPALLLLAPVANHHELGRRRLRALDSHTLSHLVLDELAVFLFCAAYCAWRVYAAWPDPPFDYSFPEHSEVFLPRMHFTTLRRVLTLATNGSLLSCSFTMQILAARFYLSLEPSVARLAQAHESFYL